MNHKRIDYLLSVLIVLSFVLTACEAPAPQPAPAAAPAAQEAQPAAAAPAAEEAQPVAAAPAEPQFVNVPPTGSFPAGTKMRLLQWSHFVPRYDTWFDAFAQDWGKQVGVDVTVDHVNLTELAPALTAAIAAGDGPTMVEMVIAAGSFVEGVQDLTDVHQQAQDLFGEEIATCVQSSYLPTLNKFYGYCHGWIPDPGDYDIKEWTTVGYPNGPSTWAELLDGGAKIKEQLGVPMGLGLSPEIDSEMAARAIIWSYGGSIQDENENVTINTPQAVEAVKYMTELYQKTMTEEVFGWNAASNNQGLIAGELSYILNSISAYRSLQEVDPAAADNIGIVPALKGPRGDQHSSAHVWQIYVVPNYVTGDELDAAKAFLLYLTANYDQATYNSKLYNFPAYKSTAPQLYAEGGWLDNDPFGSNPPDKLKVLRTAEDWVTYLGYPGPSNPAVAEVYATHVIQTMMSKAALGQLSAEDAVAEAEAQINDIFAKWRARGLVGGGQ